MKYKSFPLASFKAAADAPEGTFEAIVAVFNNVDRGGDKILPGAFAKSLQNWEAKGRPIPVIFSHEWDNLDAHIGQVLEAKEVEQGLYVKGQLEMDEPFAQRVWKKMSKGTLAEFSFAYDVVDAVMAKIDGEYINELRELELLEVGPCLVGMNPDTQLLGVKAKKACPVHSTATDDGAWDGPANEKNVPSGKTAAFYRKVYAWQDPEGDETVKSSYRFIHHLVDADGNPGAANTRACSATVAILNGGRGVNPAEQPWGADREGIHAHVARHLRDGGMDVPPLKSLEEASKAASPLADLSAEELTALKGFLASLMGKEGRRNSSADQGRIQRIHDAACELGAKCEQASSDEPDDEAQQGKSSGKADTLAARVALELLEAGVG